MKRFSSKGILWVSVSSLLSWGLNRFLIRFLGFFRPFNPKNHVNFAFKPDQREENYRKTVGVELEVWEQGESLVVDLIIKRATIISFKSKIFNNAVFNKKLSGAPS